jgi:nucleotide-binding universal stress UspA family protein
MKSILVPVEDHDRTDAILSATALFARLFGSRVTGFALSPATTPFLAADVVGASILYEPLTEQTEQNAAAARGALEKFMTAGTIGWDWRDGVAPGDHMVGYLGRVFDITVVGRPEQRVSGPRALTLDAALFDSGRPVLIAPPKAPASIGSNVVIAWNRSTETARCVALALPVLEAARSVTVLTVEGSGVPGPDGQELADYLGARGIGARALTVSPGKRTAGEAILEEAAALECDLLVKGAFTQSRIRQIIFGGATRHILESAELPVFMAH